MFKTQHKNAFLQERQPLTAVTTTPAPAPVVKQPFLLRKSVSAIGAKPAVGLTSSQSEIDSNKAATDWGKSTINPYKR